MTSRHPAPKRLGIVTIGLLLFCLAPVGPLFCLETPRQVVVTSVGMGAPPAELGSVESPETSPDALDDAEKKAVLIYLYQVLGPEEFSRLENAVDTLIVPEYKKYVATSEILSVSVLSGGYLAVVSAAVTIDAAALAGYLENIERLDPEPRPEVPRTLSAAEKERLIAKAQAIYIQAEVASDILLDRLRGIESFTAARTIFETAESAEGVYRCLMGIGRAHASLGDVAAATTAFNRALALASELKRADYFAGARIARARLLAAAGDVTGARREIRGTLDDPSILPYDVLIGEALLIDAELDYRGREYEPASTKLGRAVEIFERLADARRLTQAHLLRGLARIGAGDGPGAVESFKLARTLADRLDDEISAAKALLGMSRAYRISGDPKTAALYLTDALKKVRESGWAAGEIACLCESAYIEAALDNHAAAETAAAAANAAALSRQDPMLVAASLAAMGKVSRSADDSGAAFDALMACVEVSSDVRVTCRDVPFLFFGDPERDAALIDLLALSAGLGAEKKALGAVAEYEGSTLAREVLLNAPPLPERDARLIGALREAALRAIAAEEVSVGGEFTRLTEASRAEAQRLRDQARQSLEDAETRISRESPRLAAFMGIKTPNPADAAHSLPVGAALVHYVAGADGACALIVTGRAVSVVPLSGGYDELSAALTRLSESAGKLSIGTDGQIPLEFSEASNGLASLLFSSIIPTAGGVTTTAIGVSPGLAFRGFPIHALGGYNEEGRFEFLGQHYTLFAASWLFARTTVEAVPRPVPIGAEVLVIGQPDVAAATPAAVPGAAGPGTQEPAEGAAPGDGGALRVKHVAPSTAWWDEQARIIFFDREDVWGASDFSRIEYLSYLSGAPVMVVGGPINADSVSTFLKETVAASEGRSVFSGYADAVRVRAAGVGPGRPVDWARFMLISDFVSEQK